MFEQGRAVVLVLGKKNMQQALSLLAQLLIEGLTP